MRIMGWSRSCPSGGALVEIVVQLPVGVCALCFDSCFRKGYPCSSRVWEGKKTSRCLSVVLTRRFCTLAAVSQGTPWYPSFLPFFLASLLQGLGRSDRKKKTYDTWGHTCVMDIKLTRELVVFETKMRQLGTFSKWFGDCSCQKKRLIKKLRQKCTSWRLRRLSVIQFHLKLILHLPVSWLSWRLRRLSSIQFPIETGIAPVKKKRLVKNLRQKCIRIIHLLTRELVVKEPKVHQLDTISKWFWNLTCQKKGFSKISRQKCTRIIHLPVSWFEWSQMPVSSIQFPSETGIFPVKKKWLQEIWGRPVTRGCYTLPSSWLSQRISSLSLIHFPSDSGIWPVKKGT
jgi:hypothetical protein